MSRPNVCEYIIVIAVWSWITAETAAERRWFFADVRGATDGVEMERFTLIWVYMT